MRAHRKNPLPLLAAALVLSGPLFAGSTSSEGEIRIIKGQKATENPGAAVLLWDYKVKGVPQPPHIVGSCSVLSPRWIMTANHCLPAPQSNEPWKFTVRVNSLQARSGGQQIHIDGWVYKNDVRLLHLAEPILDPHPVKLASQLPPRGAVLQTYGWGSEDAKVDKGVEDLKWCTAKMGEPGTDYSGGPSYTSTGISGTAYKGDSGGPQFYNGEQVGVASTAAPAAYYMNYASVVAHRAWIDKTIASDELPPDMTPLPTQPPASLLDGEGEDDEEEVAFPNLQAFVAE